MPDTLTPEQEARLEAEVWALEGVANQHKQNGDLEQSYRVSRQALANMEVMFGPIDNHVACFLQGFGSTLYHDEHFEEGEAMCLRAITIYEALHGPVHLEVAGALTWLGYRYDDWERYEMSVPVYRRALAIEETICGKYSSEAQTTCVWLGDAYVQLSQYAQAEPYFKRAILIGRTRLAIDGPWLLALTQERLAGMLFRLKRYAEALAAYADVLALNDGKFQWKQSRRRFNLCRARCTSGTE